MKVSIASEIFQKKSDLQTVFILAENLHLRKSVEELNQYYKICEQNFAQKTELKNIPYYKDCLVGFGLSEVSSSLESLHNLVKKGKSLYLGNSIIDFYNAFGFDHEVSLGAYDVDRLGEDLSVCDLAGERLQFKQLNKDSFLEVSGVVFRDENEVLCADWVSKQSDNQKIRSTTKNVLFRLEMGAGYEDVIDKFKSQLQDWFEFENFQAIVLNIETSCGVFELSTELMARRERFRDYDHLLERGVSTVLVRDNLMAKLIDGDKLRIKHGVDPTGSMLHIGHGVNYIKLREFQDRGHTVVFLIGSFTARLGDPTDKSESRRLLTVEEVKENAKDYLNMVGRILDINNNIEIVYNGDWYDEMKVDDFIRLMGRTTVAKMLERDMFQKRIQEGRGIGLHELVYPLLQGYDSVVLKTDLTVIGNDQTFNELQARPLMEDEGMYPQDLIAMDLLVGTDGVNKMGKSLGNFVAFDDKPEDKFGKIMSIPDHAILTYFEASTRVSKGELDEIRLALLSKEVNPRDLKMQLAWRVVELYDSAEAADKAREHFVKVFQEKEKPVDMLEVFAKDGLELIDFMKAEEIVTSSSEARRLIDQGAVKLNDVVMDDIGFRLSLGEYTLKVGKRKFYKLIVN